MSCIRQSLIFIEVRKEEGFLLREQNLTEVIFCQAPLAPISLCVYPFWDDIKVQSSWSFLCRTL